MEHTPLEIRNIARVTEEAQQYTYMIEMVDAAGAKYMCVFATLPNFAEGLERYLTRMVALRLRGDKAIPTEVTGEDVPLQTGDMGVQ